jgi:hypothetical protein
MERGSGPAARIVALSTNPSGCPPAKAQGKALGWPPIEAEKEAAIRADLRLGKAGLMKLAAAHGVGVGTVQRIRRALALNAV